MRQKKKCAFEKRAREKRNSISVYNVGSVFPFFHRVCLRKKKDIIFFPDIIFFKTLGDTEHVSKCDALFYCAL